MNKFNFVLLSMLFCATLFLTSCEKKNDNTQTEYDEKLDSLRFPGETHLRNIKQLTFGGNNAEAYWSFDDKKLIFQSDWDQINSQGCDQIFIMNSDGITSPGQSQYKLVSTGKGKTTCSYFLKDGRMVYCSTHEADSECPETSMFVEGKYVWPIHDSFDIYITSADGLSTELLIGGEGYDAEPTASPDGKYLVFTSTRSGDLELYRFDLNTKEIIQLTDELGYDGGAFFSHDSKKIVWRASRPTGDDAVTYKDLLKQNLVQPKALNIFVADIDGKNVQQITELPGANWAPYFHPGDNKILFSSNHHSQESGGRLFDVFMINLDGTGLEQITNSNTFDAFPMFSRDGKKIVFASNRRVDREDSRETNIFVADWIE